MLHAQERRDASGARVPDRRRGGEVVAMYLSAGSWGFRTGTLIQWAAGRRADEGDALAYWSVPAGGAVVMLGALFALDRARPLRSGRALTVGAGSITGTLLSLALTMQMRGESSPSQVTLSAWPTWIGNTVGILGGMLVGHLTDATVGQGLYVATGSVGGVLMGLYACGIAQCGSNVGTWAFVGTSLAFAATAATAKCFNPPEREMQFVGLGAVIGIVPGVATLVAHATRDGAISSRHWARASAMSLGGVVVGGLAAYAAARATRPLLDHGETLSLGPMFDASTGTPMMGLSAMGMF
jgi:hypothetical protein